MEETNMIDKVGYEVGNTYFDLLLLLCMTYVTSHVVRDFCWT